MAAKRTTLAHLALSAAISVPKPAGVSDSGVLPTCASCAVNAGSATLALIAALSFSITAGGQSFGAVMPFHE